MHFCNHGVVDADRLWGVSRTSVQSPALHLLVDRFSIHSAIRSLGSTPDRKSRAVQSL